MAGLSLLKLRLSVMCAGHARGALQVRPPALVCEYLAAGSLRAAISHDAPWLKQPLAKVKVLLDTARGLDYLHARQVVHFDLKSANLLVGFSNGAPIAKVADFGLSKQKNRTYVTGRGQAMGTACGCWK